MGTTQIQGSTWHFKLLLPEVQLFPMKWKWKLHIILECDLLHYIFHYTCHVRSMCCPTETAVFTVPKHTCKDFGFSRVPWKSCDEGLTVRKRRICWSNLCGVEDPRRNGKVHWYLGDCNIWGCKLFPLIQWTYAFFEVFSFSMPPLS